MSMTPITPGQYNPDPTEPDLGDLDAAFTRVFNTPPDDAPTVDLAAGESVVDSSNGSTREEGGGEGGVSPVATPPATPSVADEQSDGSGEGGATDFTLPLVDGPQTDGVVIVDDSAAPPIDPTPPAPPPAPPSDEVDLTRLMENYLGRKPTVAEARDLLGLIDDLNSGRAIISSPQAQAPAPPPVQQPLSTTPPPAPQFDEWGMPVEPAPSPSPASLPPEVAQELEEMRQWRQQQEAAQQAQWQQWVTSEQAQAAQEFTSAAPIPMSNEDLIALEIKASKSGVFALEYQRTQNPRAAWKAALEQTLYADPAFRDRVIEAQARARATDDTETQNRVRLAASVAAGGGSAPGSIPSPIQSGPTDMAGAKSAAARDLAQIWEQS